MKKLFDEIPVIESDQLILRKLTDADAPLIEEMTQSKLIYRYEPTFLFERQYTDKRQMIRDVYGEVFETKQNLILGIHTIEENQLCGLAEFYGYKESLHKVCIGYRLRESYWGKGIATQAGWLMMDYLLNSTDVEIITASTMVENRASARVLIKNGFTLVNSAVPEDWGYDHPTLADKWIL